MNLPSIIALVACFSGSKDTTELRIIIGLILGGAFLVLGIVTWASWQLATHGWASRDTFAGKIQTGAGLILFSASAGVWAWLGLMWFMS